MSTFMNTDPKAFSGVWVFCEQRQGKMMPTTFELISEGRKLADELGVELGGIYETYNKPLETYDYEKLKDHPLIDATTIGLKGSPTNIFKSFTPPQKGVGMMLEGDGKDAVDQLFGILTAKHII